ncbi:hypothetical protein [Streptomyces bambusae]|uniref:Uncharacterized protein n=1 Tax=Streptomyces bambusae TaxID=1550616 RepID=A0ABS6Z534_9ACTN|nr:hypothetical protein [Streptomyces bambusae]MBW5482842.1 hypothetical protein [Streptomyces bambusae]
MEKRIKGAAILGAEADRAVFLDEDDLVHEYRRRGEKGGEWTREGTAPRPWHDAFPEVHHQIPAGDLARMALLFADGMSDLHWVHCSPSGGQHIVCTAREHTAKTVRRPGWWPQDGDHRVVGAVVLPGGTVLYAAQGALHVVAAGQPGSRTLAPAPPETSALCFDALTGTVHCFAGRGSVHGLKLGGDRPADHSLTPAEVRPVGSLWP